MSMNLFLKVKQLFFISMISMPINAYSWTFDFDFENDTVGQRSSGFNDAAEYSIVTTEQSFSGNKSLRMGIDAGHHGFGKWGGRKSFPTSLSEGDEIWIRARTLVPASFDVTTDIGFLKFFRVLVEDSSSNLLGHVDMYIRGDGSFRYQNELETTDKMLTRNTFGTFLVGEIVTGQSSGATARVKAIKTDSLVFEYTGSRAFSRWEVLNGSTSGASTTLNRIETNSVTNFAAAGTFARDVWKTFIYRIRFSASRPLVQFYTSVGGSYQLIFEDTSDYTLKSPTDKATTFLLFTYWNGNSPQTQHMYIDDLYFSTEPPPEIGTRPKRADQAPAL